jgi:hypothetical protein
MIDYIENSIEYPKDDFEVLSLAFHIAKKKVKAETAFHRSLTITSAI